MTGSGGRELAAQADSTGSRESVGLGWRPHWQRMEGREESQALAPNASVGLVGGWGAPWSL